jgi:hypothetical protein
MPRSNGVEVIEKEEIIMETVTQGLSGVCIPQTQQEGVFSPDKEDDPSCVNYGRQAIPG